MAVHYKGKEISNGSSYESLPIYFHRNIMNEKLNHVKSLKKMSRKNISINILLKHPLLMRQNCASVECNYLLKMKIGIMFYYSRVSTAGLFIGFRAFHLFP